MPSRSVNVERLWSMDDDTVCLLVERADAPRFEIWRSNLLTASNRRSSVAC
jgi:hypothetical protein